MTPVFGKFHQVAWVTPDLERSMAQFREVYGIPSFFVQDQCFNARVGNSHGEMRLRFALANVDGVEFELIEPVGPGLNAIYREVLPKDGSFANVFHHICIKVCGSAEDWERHLAALHPSRQIHYMGDVGPGAAFCYTDDRSLLGHYVEHVWFGREIEKAMYEAVPRYRTSVPS
ncbi:VOC family protein [Paraburkholderia phymatum]|uniref:VOC family protein n=1 Tax=Paraburkholderia phymatum TaxID=148447 RepID=UPI00317D2B3A